MIGAGIWVVGHQSAELFRSLLALPSQVGELVVGLGPYASERCAQVARAFGARLLRFETEAADQARQALLEAGASEWVLMLEPGDVVEGVVAEPLTGDVFHLEVVGLEAGKPALRFQAPMLVRRAAGLRYEGALSGDLEPAIARAGLSPALYPGLRIMQAESLEPEAERQARFERYRASAEVGLAEAPESADAWRHAGIARLLGGEMAGAVEALARSRAGDALGASARMTSYLLEARAWGAQRRDAEARRVLEAAIAEFPDFPEYHFELGIRKLQSGAWREARPHFEACLAAPDHLFPTAVRVAVTGLQAHLNLAAIGWLEGDAAAVRAHLEAAGKIEPDERDRLTAFHDLLAELEQRRQATSSTPGVEAVTAALAGKETVDEIVGVLRLYTEEFPRCESGFQVLGQTLSSLGQDEEAAFALLSSLSLNSSDAMNYQLLSFALMTLGKLDWADACQAMGDFLDGLGAFPALPESDGSALDEELARVLLLARPTVSACLIVKNEAAVLERCLASLKDVVDEIIVVDTGSTDETVAIAERHGAKVSHFTWCDDFAAARNASLAQASSDWILVIDADETLVLDDPAAFKQALHFRKYGGYCVEIRNQYEAGEVVQSPTVRLIPRDARIRYRGRLHETVDGPLVALGWPIGQLPGVHLTHVGYHEAFRASRDKHQRNLSLALRGAGLEPESVRAWALLGSAAAGAQDHQLACEAFEVMFKLYDRDPEAEDPNLDKCVVAYQHSLRALGRGEAAIAVVGRYLNRALHPGPLLVARAEARQAGGDRLGADLDRLAGVVSTIRV